MLSTSASTSFVEDGVKFMYQPNRIPLSFYDAMVAEMCENAYV